MKVVNVNGTRYYIYNKDDEISLSHELARQGYSPEQIARLLGRSVRTVISYLQSC